MTPPTTPCVLRERLQRPNKINKFNGEFSSTSASSSMQYAPIVSCHTRRRRRARQRDRETEREEEEKEKEALLTLFALTVSALAFVASWSRRSSF